MTKSFEFTGHVESTYYDTLTKVVRCIAKNNNTALLTDLSKSMNDDEKAVIKEIKEELKL